jgi:8-oxo-dGTP pyrophosphatase MutT (NUDIX family)
MIKPWTTLSSQYLVKDRWLTLRADRCETSTGFIVEPYYVQELPDWVNIVAFDAEQRILLVEQYRHGVGRISLELPAGCVDHGEKPETSARRELLEETGCTVRELFQLPDQFPNPARSNNKMFQFVGLGAELVGSQKLDPSEGISFQFVPVREVLAMIDEGRFRMTLHTTNIFMGIRYLNSLGQSGAVEWKSVAL